MDRVSASDEDIGDRDDDDLQESSGEQVIESWFDQYADALYRFASLRTGAQALAEELVQETFLAALTGIDRFRKQSSVSTWLFAILKRKIADHYRREQRHDREGNLRAEEVEVSDSKPLERNWDDDPARLYEDREFWKTFDTCVEKLPNKLAEVFILREVNQHSPREICELLGLGATNLSMRLHRCRIALRDCLNKNWFDDENK